MTALPHDQILMPVSNLDGLCNWQLNCPHCGEVNVDRVDMAPDHLAVTVHPDRDKYESPIGTRGGYVQIDLQCPHGHAFALIIANHKGFEFIGIVDRAASGN